MPATLTSRTTSILGTYFLSTEHERSHGRNWYNQAHTAALDMSRDRPLGVIATAGVIAALSPNNKWSRNLLDADSLISAFLERGAWEASQVRVCTYDTNKSKALTILKLQSPTVEDVVSILHGRKVSAFFHCILGNQQSVCVDGHAYSIWAGEDIPTTRAPKISQRLYEQISDDYRRASYLVNLTRLRHEPPITPAQLQAITWVTHRRLKGLS